MGEMTTTYGRTPADVRGWPADPAARKALQEYLETVPGNPVTVEQLLGGGGLNFSGADMSGLDLAEADFVEARLDGARLVGADLYRAWLIGASLRGANLTGCRLRKVVGRVCDMRDSILRETDMERAQFEDADFRGADLSGTSFGRGYMFGCDLRGADLSNCEFGSSVGSASLWESRLAGCRVAGAHGPVDGPIDIGADAPHLIDGDELRDWFASQGAPLVEVTTPRS